MKDLSTAGIHFMGILFLVFLLEVRKERGSPVGEDRTDEPLAEVTRGGLPDKGIPSCAALSG